MTLLLSVLLLAAISSIVFSIAAVVINEIRTSSDLTKSEPAITAAGALGEDMLFKAVRYPSYVSNCSNPASNTLNSVQVSTCTSYYLPSPDIVDLAANAQFNTYLYNPAIQNGAPGYTSVSVQLTSGLSGKVDFCTYDITEAQCLATPNIDSKSLNAAGPNSWSSPALNSSSQYQLIIVNGASGQATYSIASTPQGLPAGVTTIQNSASNQGVSRKLEITVPQ